LQDASRYALGVEACSQIATRIGAVADASESANELRAIAFEAARAGNIDDCERMLSDAESHDLRAAQSDLPNVRAHLAAAVETRLVRALIEELAGNGKRAARHYKAAQRCLPIKDFAGRLRLAEQQVLALMKHGEQHDDIEALEQAVEASSGAAELVTPTDDPDGWAGWQLTQARLLMSLGRRDGRAERFESAARAANAAAEVWYKSENLIQWAESRLLVGQALHARGDQISSVGVLCEAEGVYRTTLGFFARDRSPEPWIAASAGLGQVLVRLGELGGGLDRLTEGVQHIVSAIDVADRLDLAIDRAALQFARGNALLGLYAEQGSEHLAADAVAALRGALQACDQARYSRQALSIRHRLGMALWALGSRAQSAETLGAAAEELVAVLDEAERIEDVSRAEEVREDLRLLYDDLSATSASDNADLRRIA
jgi:tetratricopeptide (TPR) repeat protein